MLLETLASAKSGWAEVTYSVARSNERSSPRNARTACLSSPVTNAMASARQSFFAPDTSTSFLPVAPPLENSWRSIIRPSLPVCVSFPASRSLEGGPRVRAPILFPTRRVGCPSTADLDGFGWVWSVLLLASRWEMLPLGGDESRSPCKIDGAEVALFTTMQFLSMSGVAVRSNAMPMSLGGWMGVSLPEQSVLALSLPEQSVPTQRRGPSV
mmetsp:Transcript_23799/g.60864  ORF Transcript_23799/g.60864 Transcript_23799/m.60864 type:complete len:212 (-) Transcript_23799:511-1146(-)